MSDSSDDQNALRAAVEAGDVEQVQALLDGGASPLGAGASLLRAAHRHLGGPRGREVFETLRRAARAACERSPARLNGLATRVVERRYDLVRDRGVRELRQAAGPRLDVLLVDAPVNTTARALATLAQAPRREADVAQRSVADAQRLAFVMRLREIDWTMIPLVFQVASPWNLEALTELAAGSSTASVAWALAGATSSRVLHVEHGGYTVFSLQGGIQKRTFEVDPHWSSQFEAPPTRDEVAALVPDYVGDPSGRLEAAARRREELRRIEEMHEELGRLGVLVPAMDVRTDGHDVQLELVGLDAAQVERVDVIVLQELGEPAVDRTQAATPSAPALATAPPPVAAAMPVAPPLVQRPPSLLTGLVVNPSAPPPLVREPPPIVSEPAPSAPPPPVTAKAPPPMVAPPPELAPTPSAEPPRLEEPPLVTEPTGRPGAPPPLVASEPTPRASEPPPARPSAPPPMVQPPPMVETAPQPVEEPPLFPPSDEDD